MFIFAKTHYVYRTHADLISGFKCYKVLAITYHGRPKSLLFFFNLKFSTVPDPQRGGWGPAEVGSHLLVGNLGGCGTSYRKVH